MLDAAAHSMLPHEPHATQGATVRRLARMFEEAGLVSPMLDARILTAEACGLDPASLILNRDAAISPGQAARIADFAARRLAGEPVSRILGRREFWGLTFRITPDTLDPRPETELLVETVLAHVRGRGVPLRILDLGTGTGCILAALLSELPNAQGIGIDRSEAALEVARDNLSRLGLRDRASFLCGDWMSAAGGTFDIIVCNPPYIAPSEICQLEPEVRVHDPYLALYGGEDGLDAYRTVIPQALAALRPGGLAVFETGHRQGEAVLGLTAVSAPHPEFSGVRLLLDLGGTARAVAAVRQC
jgi:release factor glutamine methyltransferase